MDVVFASLLRTAELALVAVGLSAVFSVSRFANIAHVEFATMGALLALLFANWLGAGLVVAGLIAAIITGFVAVAAQRTIFRRLVQAGAAMAMVGSLALEIFARAGFQTLFGARPRSFDRPLQQSIEVLGGRITPTQITVILTAAIALTAFMLVLFRTKMGRQLRAVAANPSLAGACGIDVQRSTDLVWFLSAVLAALGGVLIAANTTVSVNIGFNLLLPIFAAAILGGIGSPVGAIMGAAIIAFVENLVVNINFGALVGSTAYLPISYAAAISFLVLVLTLLTRPEGLLGGGARHA